MWKTNISIFSNSIYMHFPSSSSGVMSVLTQPTAMLILWSSDWPCSVRRHRDRCPAVLHLFPDSNHSSTETSQQESAWGCMPTWIFSAHRNLPTHCQFRTLSPQVFTAKDDNSLTKAGCTNNRESQNVHVAADVKVQLGLFCWLNKNGCVKTIHFLFG